MQELCAYAVNAKMITLFGMCKFMHYANLHDFGSGVSIFGTQNFYLKMTMLKGTNLRALI